MQVSDFEGAESIEGGGRDRGRDGGGGRGRRQGQGQGRGQEREDVCADLQVLELKKSRGHPATWSRGRRLGLIAG